MEEKMLPPKELCTGGTLFSSTEVAGIARHSPAQAKPQPRARSTPAASRVSASGSNTSMTHGRKCHQGACHTQRMQQAGPPLAEVVLQSLQHHMVELEGKIGARLAHLEEKIAVADALPAKFGRKFVELEGICKDLSVKDTQLWDSTRCFIGDLSKKQTDQEQEFLKVASKLRQDNTATVGKQRQVLTVMKALQRDQQEEQKQRISLQERVEHILRRLQSIEQTTDIRFRPHKEDNTMKLEVLIRDVQAKTARLESQLQQLELQLEREKASQLHKQSRIEQLIREEQTHSEDLGSEHQRQLRQLELQPEREQRETAGQFRAEELLRGEQNHSKVLDSDHQGHLRQLEFQLEQERRETTSQRREKGRAEQLLREERNHREKLQEQLRLLNLQLEQQVEREQARTTKLGKEKDILIAHVIQQKDQELSCTKGSLERSEKAEEEKDTLIKQLQSQLDAYDRERAG